MATPLKIVITMALTVILAVLALPWTFAGLFYV